MRVLLTSAVVLMLWLASSAHAEAVFSPPATGRATYNFNPGWKFIRDDVANSEAPDFDDSRWADVSTPHTYNDVDTFDGLIARGGEAQQYMGPARYRKHFKLPAAAPGSRVVLEFEGMRQAAKFWVNGKFVGQHEDGVTAVGVDITDAVQFASAENVLAVWVTNANNYQEEATKVSYQWVSKDFNPSYGGLNRNVRLHVLPPVHFTLPLLNNLKTTGTYVYASDFNLTAGRATIHAESEVHNGTATKALIETAAIVVDHDGRTVATLPGEKRDVAAGESAVLKATGPIAAAHWWSPADPYLYDVYSVLKVDGKTVDAARVRTGFRQVEFKGGAGTGGVFINGQFTYLKGYAQRTTNEWATVGAAYPDWMHDFDANLIKATHSNYVRWMHIAPRPQEVAACDKAGIVEVCPAGDKEANPKLQRQWEQRVEVMRATIIAYRNSPSILFWEAGNNGLPADRMKQMVALRKELDPHGGRAMGCRSLPAHQPTTNTAAGAAAGNGDLDANEASAAGDENANVAEYFGVMVAQDDRTDKLKNSTDMFRYFSGQRRDIAPFIETEDFRDEALRRYWDDFTPPLFKKGKNDTYGWNSETFCLAAAKRYNAYYANRISNADPSHSRWAAYASIIWADSNQHGRMPDSAVCRVSGKVDAVRLPKQAFYAYRVMQNDQPDLHLIGHWNYAAGTKKPVYVIANHVDAVELQVNGKSISKQTQPTDGYVYTFPDVVFTPGSIKAIGFAHGQVVAEQELQTSGPAAAIKLTPHTAPNGLQADGADVAFVDVEVVDAQGRRCPTDESRIDFDLTGPALWRGGVNEYLPGTTNRTYLNTEGGINRVFVRSTREAGTITLTAKRPGVSSQSITMDAHPVAVRDGLLAVEP